MYTLISIIHVASTDINNPFEKYILGRHVLGYKDGQIQIKNGCINTTYMYNIRHIETK